MRRHTRGITSSHRNVRGQVIWEGVIESFDLTGHPKANRCYAFYIMEDDGPQFTTVLEIPPVDSPQTAV